MPSAQSPARPVTASPIQTLASSAFSPSPDATLSDALRSLASRAGVVFVGQVIGVQRHAGSVVVSLRVDQPVIGNAGPVYMLREWAGLWSANQQRFTVGQRALFFLHAPGMVGFSSPVDGMEGIVPLVPMGADRPPLLDVRWLQTRLQRTPSTPLPPAEQSAIALADAVNLAAHWRQPTLPEPARLPLPAGVLPGPPPDAQPVPVATPILPPIIKPVATPLPVRLPTLLGGADAR